MEILIPDDSGGTFDDYDPDQSREEMRLWNEDDKGPREAELIKAHLRLLRGETITYLYRWVNAFRGYDALLDDDDDVTCRVAPGISLDSHAARCAQMFGLPPPVVRRAQYVTYVGLLLFA